MTKNRPTFDDYTFLNRWGLSFLGIWREEKNVGYIERWLYKIHVATLFVLMTLLLIPEWLDMYVLWGNIDATAETFVLNVFTICAMLKLWCFHRVRHTFDVSIFRVSLTYLLENMAHEDNRIIIGDNKKNDINVLSIEMPCV